MSVQSTVWESGKTVEPGKFSKPVEFHGFKNRIVESLPDSQEFYRIAIPYPVPDQIIGIIRILVSCNISNADVILIIQRMNGNFVIQYMDLCHYRSPVQLPVILEIKIRAQMVKVNLFRIIFNR